MVGLFKRDKESKKISEEDKDHLAEVSYKLGYEVGYHRHSEIGWVQEQLNKLYGFAEEYDLRDFARENYIHGKDEGAKAKERDTKSGLFRGAGKESTAEPDKASGFTPESTAKASFTKSDSGFTVERTSIESSSTAIQQPTLTDLPENVQLTKAVERPSILEGSKHLLPKKK
ncbi:hypothetical protein HWN40_01245 [Methanolobus zinderi]|uniref:Uncharacterized protein n=1 Tax=Methanolobus zinderi TaxID=536044 RepID=A0A7D5ECS6_9EURY|nr:hypothetical protein [Methanolobus zinderi]QLC48994.1 hypothetical protein HWN40_01245 [Methanolobus zinderi]